MRSRATAEHHRLEEARSDDGSGAGGARTCPSASGARCARTTRPTAKRGTTSRSITPRCARTAGATTACSASATTADSSCFCVALWNGADAILKERLFGVSGKEGNHGEDVKELYWYLDATPTCSYARALYKYPHARLPVRGAPRPVARRQARPIRSPRSSTPACFDDDRYFDVVVEYAKADVERRPRSRHRHQPRAESGAASSSCRSSGFATRGAGPRAARGPRCSRSRRADGVSVVEAREAHLGAFWLHVEGADESALHRERVERAAALGLGQPRSAREGRVPRRHRPRARGRHVEPRGGTKVGARFTRTLEPGQSVTVRLRYADRACGAQAVRRLTTPSSSGASREADEFYDAITPASLGPDERRVFRQSIAGLLWSKQFYAYDVERWLRGDPGQPAPPRERWSGRNSDVAAPLQQRSPVDARQVGVPLVRGVGPRVPLHPARAGRPGLRQAAAHAARARVVHAPQRAAPGVRVAAGRREPARARVGGATASTRSSGARRAAPTGRSSSRSSSS